MVKIPDTKRSWNDIVADEFNKAAIVRQVQKYSNKDNRCIQVDKRREEIIQGYLMDTMKCIKNIIVTDTEKIKDIVDILVKAYDNKKQVIIMGNGGSASIAEHMAADLSKAYLGEQKGLMGLRAISLTDNVSLLTSWMNDAGLENMFLAQLETMLLPGDVVIGISGSGSSKNVTKAIEFANFKGAITIGFTGLAGSKHDGGDLRHLAHICFVVPDQSYKRIEDMHALLGHLIKSVLVDEIQNRKNKAVFFDRDGVLNASPKMGDYIKDVSELVINDSMVDVVKELRNQGYKIIVVTNQACIGKGIITEDKLKQIHVSMEDKLHKHGTMVDAYYYCPHKREDKCKCRKPETGMIKQAIKDFNIDVKQSFLVGDSLTDIEAAKKAKLNPILYSPIGKDEVLVSDQPYSNTEVMLPKQILGVVKRFQ